MEVLPAFNIVSFETTGSFKSYALQTMFFFIFLVKIPFEVVVGFVFILLGVMPIHKNIPTARSVSAKFEDGNI